MRGRPIPRLLRSLALLVVLAAAGLAFLVWRGAEPGGIDDAYTLVFGPPDLGPVDFAVLERRRTPNDALVCAPAICRRAASDRVPGTYPVSGERLRALVGQVAEADADVEPLHAATLRLEDRYLARTPLMRFPDTINVMVVEEGTDAATLALYGRSQIGYSDFGVNRARLERWMDRIEALVAREPRPGPAGTAQRPQP